MQHRAWLQQLRLTVPYSHGEYTAAFSGPIVFPKIYNGHDKTFFLATWTLQDEKFNTTYNTDVPSLAALNGDFSFPAAINGGYPIYDPSCQWHVDTRSFSRQHRTESPMGSRGRQISFV